MQDTTDAGLSLGGQPSIIESFSVEGLHGYRTVGLASRYAATVLIARNGAGKTTLLAVLDAFLKRQFSRLSTVEFSCIRCRLRGWAGELLLYPNDIEAILRIPESSELLVQAGIWGMDPGLLLDFLDNEYSQNRPSADLADNDLFMQIMGKVKYSFLEAKRICDRLVESLKGRSVNIDEIKLALETILGSTEIVYLPTYRRIELPLAEDIVDDRYPSKKRKSVQSQLGLSKRGLYNADIQFGLRDISDRLETLNEEILYKSNQGYREISANIINELLSGAFERDETKSDHLPDKDTLNLFFSRLKDGRKSRAFTHVAIPNIDRIYSGENISPESNKFLSYFLTKLNEVINSSQDVEATVQDFILSCNRYLSSDDDSTTLTDRPHRTGLDGKALKLDKRNLRVNVESLSTKRRIPLDSLSSGEKQMISLFARLYLYSGKKIVLIDEPELSLSIGWQTKILPDVLRAPSCDQVIAITHSPFVFDNELEPFARALTVSIDTGLQGSEDDEEYPHE
jgi:energy-coupling factor transporter ATP-binding protein EcfA2